MRRTVRAAGLWLVLVLLLAGLSGCGASPAPAATTTTAGQQDVAAIWHELVQCARQNGMPNLPDPVIDANGEPHFPGGDPGEAPPSVERACKHIYDRLPASAGGGSEDEERPPADIQGLVAFAACIREHGVPDWPDPKPDGTFPIVGTAIEREGKSPRVIAAMQACQQLNPDPKGGIHGS
jgi:hypothetical protein